MKKEVAERLKRGAETNAGHENRGAAGGDEGPAEWGGGVPLPNRLGRLGKRRELHSGVRGRAPAENEFCAFCCR